MQGEEKMEIHAIPQEEFLELLKQALLENVERLAGQ